MADAKVATNATAIPDSEFEHLADMMNMHQQREPAGWETVCYITDAQDNTFFVLLRRLREDLGGLYEYRSMGRVNCDYKTYCDVQLDLEYHLSWDTACSGLKVIESVTNDIDLIHWVVKYPWPMSDRDYVYLRRVKNDTVNDLPVCMIANRMAVSFPDAYKPSSSVVRVESFISHSVFWPADNNACNYIFSGVEDPKVNLPKSVLSWVATKGIPNFIESLKKACQEYPAWKKKKSTQ